ncbi:radical SAM protein [candidate division KSB1 bacterium]|nr:radical SAM protein [candidate division KSB1 bacterium]
MAFENKYVRTVKAADFKLWEKAQPRLLNLDIELTERCNNNCLHCCINLPENDESARQRELTTDELKKILREAASLGCLSVRLTGGEPLLRPDFAELYLFIRKLGIKVLLFTNATLINADLIQLFRKYPPGELIEVTVYGMTQRTYEAVSRVKGTFAKAFRGITLLLENNIPFVVKSALLPQNREDIPAFEAWAKSIPWMTKPPRYSMFFDLRNRRDSDKNDLIARVRATPDDGIDFIMRNPEAYRKDMQAFCAKFTSPPGDKLFTCGAGKKSGTIDAYGNFQVCMLVRHPATLYDLRRGSLQDALDNFFPHVLAAKAKNSDYLQKCAKCFLKGLCEQCPGKAWTEHGTLDTPVSYLCDIAHKQARLLGLLDEHEWAWQVEDWRQRIDRFVASE